MNNIQIRKQNKSLDNEDLEQLSKQELIQRIQSLNAHNVQLKSILAKTTRRTTVKRNKKLFDFEKCAYRHILLKFFYLGWDYHGYATQEDTSNTIENFLFEALKRTCLIKDRTLSNYHRCGRTDKGVSSFGQVISIDIRSKLAKENQSNFDEELDYCKILNNVLPDDIQCVAWSPADDNLSARFDCLSRTYKYFFPKGNLNIEKMEYASKFLVGSHDFRNLCKMDVGNGVVEFVRNITYIDIIRLSKNQEETSDEYNVYVITIKGQAFLWHQIRCIMGILFLIGEGNEQPELIKELLDVEKTPRKPDYNMASELPLNLYHCEYDDENLKWQYDFETLSTVLKKLKMKWTLNSIKTTMIKSMINDLECILETHESCATKEKNMKLTNCLLQGVKCKTYVPVMKRQKCESLENKIKHYAKRSRIEIKEAAVK